jgi:hypothetical protein
MKKKLVLHKETLRSLSNLNGIRGAGSGDISYPSCLSWCGYECPSIEYCSGNDKPSVCICEI